MFNDFKNDLKQHESLKYSQSKLLPMIHCQAQSLHQLVEFRGRWRTHWMTLFRITEMSPEQKLNSDV